jgi:hypothetical protein
MKITNKYIFNELESIISSLKSGYTTTSDARISLATLQAKAREIGLELTVPSNEELTLLFNVDDEDYHSSDPDYGSSY